MEAEKEQIIASEDERKAHISNNALILTAIAIALGVMIFVISGLLGLIIFGTPVYMGSYILYRLIKIWSRREPPAAPPPADEAELFRVVYREASITLDLSSKDLHKSFATDLKVNLGDIGTLLENLSIDHSLPVSDADAGKVDSLEDIISLIHSRMQLTAEA